MKIEVKKVDIQRGQACNPYCCPIALAVYRVFPGLRSTKVLATTVEILGRHYKLPQRVTQFIQRFDDSTYRKRKEMEPFSFNLRAGRAARKGEG